MVLPANFVSHILGQKADIVYALTLLILKQQLICFWSEMIFKLI